MAQFIIVAMTLKVAHRGYMGGDEGHQSMDAFHMRIGVSLYIKQNGNCFLYAEYRDGAE